jgi:PIN domain nuclease of toxin-antitoxin system
VVLLDTHVLVWLAVEPSRLSAAAVKAIGEAANSGGIAIASITLLELATLIVRGRLLPGGPPASALEELVARTGVVVKDITPAIAVLAVQLPEPFPGDPADRVIVATAHVEGIPLITRDAKLRRSVAVQTIW